MSLAKNILSSHSSNKDIAPGDFVNVKVDLILANDITAPLAIKEFEKIGAKKVFNPEKIVFVQDHFVPARDVRAAEQSKLVREFAKKYGILHYDVGKGGIEHILLPEEGLVLPGDVVIGADSHTTTYGALSAFSTGMGSTDIACAMATGEIWMKVPPTYKFIYHGKLPRWVGGKDLILYTIGEIGVEGASYAAMEFSGETVRQLTMDDRFTMANMSIEAGAKVGLFEVDEKTMEYVKERAKREFKIPEPDDDYDKIYEFEVSDMEPQVALPSSPANVKAVGDVRGIEIDQVVIGSCTNGRLKDLREAAEIIKHKKVHKDVRLIVIPGSQKIYLEALKEGLIQTFIEAGGAVCTPTCGPCLGGHTGVLAAGEKCLSTTNRNFVGRMGSRESEVYLANPAVAAASAILGRIAHPDEVKK
ncbi:MAG: 3-isopropylmalate dehydratase large subunit [Candidatus Methanospirareceae archaeon]